MKQCEVFLKSKHLFANCCAWNVKAAQKSLVATDPTFFLSNKKIKQFSSSLSAFISCAAPLSSSLAWMNRA